ncbi:MAG: hypothetical protein ACKO41_03730 [Sphingomonadales bacterium]
MKHLPLGISLFLLSFFSSSSSYGQPSLRQFGAGLTKSFLPVNNMLIGKVGIEQIPQNTIWLDYNKSIRRSNSNLRWGVSASINYERFFYTIDQPLPYFTPERQWYIFLAAGIKNVELYGYLAKQINLYESDKWRIGVLPRLGPVFHIQSMGDYLDSGFELKNDGVTVFPAYEIYFTRPKWYVPYLRGVVSLDVVRRFRSGIELGISPMISLAAFSQDNAVFITMPDDPNYRSLGTFKINRGFYGINLIIGKLE